ncbi:MAG TPA: TIGR01548 family HAD-type hydrolase [Spirochaetes bacterium]|nr:TIGR01548 family HAD-type hydrolase [Spirochaetota bacterium]
MNRINTPLDQLLDGIKLLIFDIDGVLVDVRSSYRLAIKKTVEYYYQKEVYPDEIQELKNESGFNNDWDLTEELLKRKNISLLRETVIDTFQSYYWGSKGDGLIQSEAWLMDTDLIETLSRQYKLSIFTGRPRMEAEFVLKKNQVIQHFHPIVAMEDVSQGKPNPEGIISICQSLNINPYHSVYFGDTFDDVRTAVTGNSIAIAVIPPGGNNDLIAQYLDLGAKTVLKSINDIKSGV